MTGKIGVSGSAMLLQFTPRERRVVEGVMRAQTVKEIARDLGISYETAKDALKNVYLKAEVHSARALMLKVMDGSGPAQDWPGEALRFFNTVFPSQQELWAEMRRFAVRTCPGAWAMTAEVGENWRVMLEGTFCGPAQVAAGAATILAERQPWSGSSDALFANATLPARCPCLAAAFYHAGERLLVVARPPRSLAFAASEAATVRLISLLAEARGRGNKFAAAAAANGLSRASIA